MSDLFEGLVKTGKPTKIRKEHHTFKYLARL